jgi:hypothetical protein
LAGLEHVCQLGAGYRLARWPKRLSTWLVVGPHGLVSFFDEATGQAFGSPESAQCYVRRQPDAVEVFDRQRAFDIAFIAA